jgi:DNA-directed RNA polymerase subunit beta
MPNSRYFLSDFVEIQRRSFFELLENGLIDEFSKRNPITSIKKDVELYFYPEYYKLTLPEYNPRQAILRCKSYTSKLYMPVQLTYKKSNTIRLKWAYIGNLPLMTKRGHFILNGAARVIVNQIIRSPGIYYQEKLHETFSQKWSQKPEVSYKRYYADLICLRGTWLRLEIDKDKNIWAQTKKGPKIPVFWFLIAMGLSERVIFNSILEPNRLVQNLGELSKELKSKKQNYPYVKNPPSAWKEIYSLMASKKGSKAQSYSEQGRKWLFNKFMNPRSYDLGKQGRSAFNRKLGLNIDENQLILTPQDLLYATDYLVKVEKGLKSLDDIDHLKNRRVRTSGELIQIQIGIALVRLEKSIREKMNKTSMQFLVKMKKDASTVRQNTSLQNNLISDVKNEFNKQNVNGNEPFSSVNNKDSINSNRELEVSNNINNITSFKTQFNEETQFKKVNGLDFNNFSNEDWSLSSTQLSNINSKNGVDTSALNLDKTVLTHDSLDSKTQKKKKSSPKQKVEMKKLTISQLINNKAFNSALREFFGTSPLSQFMDQINPLAEITHKRRLSSMGPGGVTRDTATLAIRGIHPTHYGRICPIETPEGKNTGLVNSMTTYARVNSLGMLESPFYKVYKGIVQKSSGMFFLSAEQEEKTKLAASDLFVTPIGFLPNSNIPVRIGENFTKIPRNNVEYIGVSPTQMISIATSLIPFLEHDDANRALMGSNMQRQAVPLIRPERPIVGTGLESRAVSDSGHVIQSKFSGVVTYVSADKIIVTTLKR